MCATLILKEEGLREKDFLSEIPQSLIHLLVLAPEKHKTLLHTWKAIEIFEVKAIEIFEVLA
ncbi:hypothetical protein CSA56_18505 [candidate division KSB3 bacterium]|uniref:Uncharacterized protein n=1 Tax=candidate division KSB3 bacterium TaxID=2044937 RepID=A0A2G6K7G5_9BACT|nr:MAG: hypothetical protein CSA56_18505 [candidate division KSB3 bacterium]